MYSLTDLNILLHLNICRRTILYRVLSPFWPVNLRKGATRIDQGPHQEQNSFHSTISVTHRLQLDKRRITRIETARKWQGHSHTSRGQRTCYCCYGQERLYRLRRRLNGKLLDLKKTETIDLQLYYRLRCRLPQSAKLYGRPQLHKSNIPMRPIIILWVTCDTASYSYP